MSLLSSARPAIVDRKLLVTLNQTMNQDIGQPGNFPIFRFRVAAGDIDYKVVIFVKG